MAFTLDTSGAVRCIVPDPPGAPDVRIYEWSDLTPFVQGKIEGFARSFPYLGRWTCRRCGWTGTEPDAPAMLHPATQDFYKAPCCPPCGQYFAEPDFPRWAFSDLSPEALALILRDCEAMQGEGLDGTAAVGQSAWAARQGGLCVPEFPPLTPYLSDDGRVNLREAQS